MPTPQLKIAYLTTVYPALSHTFIEREVRQLRKIGIQVETFSVRPPPPSGLLSDENQAAFQSTVYLLSSYHRLFFSISKVILFRPQSFVKALWSCQALSPIGNKNKLWHLIYLFEAAYLGECLIKKRITHLHVHLANNGAAVAYLTCILYPKLTYSLSVHGPTEFSNTKAFSLEKKIQGALFVRCISEYCRSQLMTLSPFSQWSKLHVVHCGVPVEKMLKKKEEKNKSRKLEILTIGRLVPEKGFPILLMACSALNDQYKNWRLRIIGEGPMEKELIRMAEDLKIQGQTEFLGPRTPKEIDTFLNDSELFVLPSFMEGIPIVLMEAMAKEVLVVGTQIAGIPELIENAKNGFLTSPGSISQLSELLSFIAMKRTEFETLQTAGHQTILTYFNIEKIDIVMSELFLRYIKPKD